MGDVTLTSQDENGFLVTEVRRERGYFAVGADLWATKAAFDAGNEGAVIACGCLHEEVLAAHPELAPLVALHMADLETGEPGQGVSNGWYRLGGGDMEYELKYRRERGHSNYHSAPEPFDESGKLTEDFIFFFWKMAADTLRCTIAELPLSLYATARIVGEDFAKAQFEEWVDTLRPRWQEEADQANAWIDEHVNELDVPAEQTDEERFLLELPGLRVLAKHEGEKEADYVDYPAWTYRYRTTVTANGHTYRFWSTGSIADHQDGVVNARQAAFGILRELAQFQYESAEELARDMGMDEEREGYPKFIAQMRDMERKADDLMPGLSANLEVIGG